MRCPPACERNATDGLCPVKHNDGLPVRCSHTRARLKFDAYRYYLDTFSTGMKNIWPKRVYIDLFAGPGYNKIRPTGDIAESGPLIAAAQRTPFTFCFFVDLSLDSCNALNSRFGKISAGRPFEVINGDCNSPQIINRITNVLDRCTLSVCIIDPTTVNVRFATIEQLTNGYRMDLDLQNN